MVVESDQFIIDHDKPISWLFTEVLEINTSSCETLNEYFLFFEKKYEIPQKYHFLSVFSIVK